MQSNSFIEYFEFQDGEYLVISEFDMIENSYVDIILTRENAIGMATDILEMLQLKEE